MSTRIAVYAILVFSLATLAQGPKTTSGGGTEISADLGPCSADFHVVDMVGKPIYNAKIHTQIRYGFLSKRKLDLDVATDASGKARFINLPSQLKKPPLTFLVTSDGERAELSYDPATNCHATYDVPLGKKEEKK